MNTKKKIEQYLKAAPKPMAPEGLLDELQRDVNLRDAGTRSTVMRRWFAPSGGTISLRRVAAAAAIAIAVLLPLTYGATKIIQFVVEEFTVMYGVDDKDAKYITTYAFNPTIRGVYTTSKDDAKKAEKEILQLIKEGKAEKISPGEYKAVLSNGGEVVYDTLGIPIEILASESREEKIKQICDEIEELRKAGKFERTFLDVVKSPKGRDVYIYKTCYTLSNGATITLNSGFGHPVKEKAKD
jgi:hypothetical protein